MICGTDSQKHYWFLIVYIKWFGSYCYKILFSCNSMLDVTGTVCDNYTDNVQCSYYIKKEMFLYSDFTHMVGCSLLRHLTKNRKRHIVSQYIESWPLSWYRIAKFLSFVFYKSNLLFWESIKLLSVLIISVNMMLRSDGGRGRGCLLQLQELILMVSIISMFLR